jgi:hypothetical protein
MPFSTSTRRRWKQRRLSDNQALLLSYFTVILLASTQLSLVAALDAATTL